MTPLHRALITVIEGALLVAAVGLIVRKRWMFNMFFAAYIAFAVVTIPMFVLWPSHFYRRWFFLERQTGLDVLKLAVALEVAWRTFRLFPAARSAALLTGLAILATTAMATSTLPIGAAASEWEVVVGQFFPRVKAGTIWLMAMTPILARWYRVPVQPFHGAVLTAFVSYLGFDMVLAWLCNGSFVSHAEILDTISFAADILVWCYWVHKAWQRETPGTIAHVAMLRKLETGFSSCP